MRSETDKQYVCLVCGYNMVGYSVAHCPFCGAPESRFITAEECSERFKVKETPVNGKVSRLNSVPSLGLEHAAYRIETGGKAYMIDSPSSFDKIIQPVDVVLFTHHHFLGASNLYRAFFHSGVCIHKLDSEHDLCQGFTFDKRFVENFTDHGIEAFHIGGHTPGFTMYIFDEVLFICDYVFLKEGGMIFNPYGPRDETIAGGAKIRNLVAGRNLKIICGYNYVTDFSEWIDKFGERPLSIGH